MAGEGAQRPVLHYNEPKIQVRAARGAYCHQNLLVNN
jgi:hypothetical protein